MLSDAGHTIYVEITCKYFRTVYFAFTPKVALHRCINATNATQLALPNSIRHHLPPPDSHSPPNDRQRLRLPGALRSAALSLTFHQGGKKSASQLSLPKWHHYDARAEYERQGILNPNSNWRLTTLNEKFGLSDTCACHPPTPIRDGLTPRRVGTPRCWRCRSASLMRCSRRRRRSGHGAASRSLHISTTIRRLYAGRHSPSWASASRAARADLTSPPPTLSLIPPQ